MFALAKLTLPSPVTLVIRRYNRPRAGRQALPINAGTEKTFEVLDLCFTLAALPQTIHAQIAGIARPLLIYGPTDFREVVTDTPDQHAQRVLEVLGSDPATMLQALCDGGDIPPLPARVPREIPNWRCKAVLSQMGLLNQVEAIMDALPEPDRTVARLAWNGDGKVARHGKTVLGLASVLNLTPAQIDAMFIAAEAIDV